MSRSNRSLRHQTLAALDDALLPCQAHSPTFAHMNEPKPQKSAALSQRIDPQLKADLEALARSDDRSLANYVQRVLQQHVQTAKKKPKTG